MSGGSSDSDYIVPGTPVATLRARRRLNFDKPLPKLKLNIKQGTSELTSTPPKEIKREESFELIESPPVTEIFRNWKDAVRGENQMKTNKEGADYHGSDQDDDTYDPRPLGLVDYIEMIETCEDIDERMNCFRKLDQYWELAKGLLEFYFSGNQECAEHVFNTYQLSDADLLKLIQEGPDYDMNEAGDHAVTGTAEKPHCIR